MSRPYRTAGLAATALAFALTLAGCSGDDDPTAAGDAPAASPSTSSAPVAAAGPFGPACAALPATGTGSLAAIAEEPVATAASQNPELSTLVTAVTKAGLVDTLNKAEAITLFAPTDDAFAKIPKGTLDKVLADKKTLTDILTYHVVEQRRAPADLNGPLATLQGGTITAAGSGDTYTANDARVVCGNVQTSNATVYLIDTVLMPKG